MIWHGWTRALGDFELWPECNCFSLQNFPGEFNKLARANRCARNRKLEKMFYVALKTSTKIFESCEKHWMLLLWLQNHFHCLSAGWDGESVWARSLPGCVCAGRTRDENRPQRKPRSGEKNVLTVFVLTNCIVDARQMHRIKCLFGRFSAGLVPKQKGQMAQKGNAQKVRCLHG